MLKYFKIQKMSELKTLLKIHQILTFVKIEHPSSFPDVGSTSLCHRSNSSSFWFTWRWSRWLNRVRIWRRQCRSRRRKSLWHEIADLTTRPHCYKQKIFIDRTSINQFQFLNIQFSLISRTKFTLPLSLPNTHLNLEIQLCHCMMVVLPDSKSEETQPHLDHTRPMD